MDSTLGSEPRRRGKLSVPIKRQHEGHLPQVSMADGEGSETEEGNATPAAPKRRRRGPRARASNDPDDDDGIKKGNSQGTCIGRRRRRHSSSRGGKGVFYFPSLADIVKTNCLLGTGRPLIYWKNKEVVGKRRV